MVEMRVLEIFFALVSGLLRVLGLANLLDDERTAEEALVRISSLSGRWCRHVGVMLFSAIIQLLTRWQKC